MGMDIYTSTKLHAGLSLESQRLPLSNLRRTIEWKIS